MADPGIRIRDVLLVVEGGELAHARQQIREAIGTAITGLTTTAARVFQSRVYPHDAAAIPGWTIYSAADDREPEESAKGGETARRLSIELEGRAKASANLDDTLDDMSSEVETAIYSDAALGALVEHLELETTELEYEDELEIPAGIIRQRWTMLYRIQDNDPETIVT